MTRKETTAIALKCFAIYILSQVIISLPTLASLGLKLKYMGSEEPSNIWIIGIPVLSVILGITTAFLIWKSTNSLLTKEATPNENSGDLGVDGIMKIVLACMGVYFVIDAAIAVPYAFVSLQIARTNPSFKMELCIMNLVTQILEFTFGGLLIAKPGKWVLAIISIGRI